MKAMIWTLQVLLGLVLLSLIAISGALLYSSSVEGEDPPRLFGYGPYQVETGEMAPSLYAGDLAILHFGADSKPGDIVAFYKEGSLVLRRVVGTSETYYITQQEAFGQPDAQLLDPAQVVAVSATYLPGCGALAVFLYSPVGLGVLILAAVVLLALPALLGLGNKAQPTGPSVDYGGPRAAEPISARRAPARWGAEGVESPLSARLEEDEGAAYQPRRARAYHEPEAAAPLRAARRTAAPEEHRPARRSYREEEGYASQATPQQAEDDAVERPRRSPGSHYKPRH